MQVVSKEFGREKLTKELELVKEQLVSERHEFDAFKRAAQKRELENEVDAAIEDGRLMPSVKDDGIVDFMMSIDSDDTYNFLEKR